MSRMKGLCQFRVVVRPVPTEFLRGQAFFALEEHRDVVQLLGRHCRLCNGTSSCLSFGSRLGRCGWLAGWW
jgi:hypothetical protein